MDAKEQPSYFATEAYEDCNSNATQRHNASEEEEEEEPCLPGTKIRRNYQCSQCSLFTQNPRTFLYHLKDEHGQKLNIYECRLCLYASRHAQKLQRHNRIVHNLLPEFHASKSLEDSTLDSLERDSIVWGLQSAEFHDKNTTAGVPRGFPEKTRLISGNNSSQQSPELEAGCFSSPKSEEDKQEGTSDLKKRFYRCTRCHYVTNVKARYTKHVKYHSMPTIKCDLCDFNTPYKWNLDRHLKNHMGGGMFQCNQCNFTAHIRQSLTVHIQNHHSEIPGPPKRRQRFFDDSEFEYNSEDTNSKSGSPTVPLIPTTVEEIQGNQEEPPRKKVRPIPNLIPISHIFPQQAESSREESPEGHQLQVMSFLDQLAHRLAQIKSKPDVAAKPLEVRPVSLTSSRCQFCRHRCKSRNDLLLHLKNCSAVLLASQAKEEIKHEDEGNLDADDCEEDGALVGLETEPGHGMVCNSNPQGPTVVRKVYKCPTCSFWATTASRFHVHMVGHTNTKPFECSECSYRSNWRWDITKHIRLKAVRDPCHLAASLILLDSSGERNYDQYEKYLTPMRVAAGAKDSTAAVPFVGKKRKHEDSTPSSSPTESPLPEKGSLKSSAVPASAPSPLSLIRGDGAGSTQFSEEHVKGGSAVSASAFLQSLIPVQPVQQQQRTVTVPKGKDSKKTEPVEPKSSQASAFSTGILMDARRTVWKCKRCPFKNNSRELVLQHIRNEHYGGEPLAANLVGRDLTWALTPKQPLTGKNLPAFRCGVCNQVSNWKHVIQRHCRLKHNGNIQVIENKVSDEETPEMSHEIISKAKPEKKQVRNPLVRDEHGPTLAETYAFMVGIPSMKQVKAEVKEEAYGGASVVSRGDERGYVVHPERHHLVCSSCPFICMQVKDMEDHQIYHQKRDDFHLKCMVCNYFTKSKEDLNQHHILHGIKQNGELTISLASSDTDQNTKPSPVAIHQTVIRRSYSCSACPFVTDSMTQLNYHSKYHKPYGGPFQCPSCSFNVDKSHLFLEHLHDHGIKPEIGEDSTSGATLDIDPNILPVLSDIVTMALSQIPLVWVSKDGKFYKMFKCRYCPYVDAKSTNVSEHEKRHFSDEPGAKCNVCNFCCNSIVALAAHQGLHSYSLGVPHALVDPSRPPIVQLSELVPNCSTNSNSVSPSNETRVASPQYAFTQDSDLEAYFQRVRNSHCSSELLTRREEPFNEEGADSDTSEELSPFVSRRSLEDELQLLNQELSKSKRSHGFPISGLELQRHLLAQRTPESTSTRCNTPSSFGAEEGGTNPWRNGNPEYTYPTCKKNGKTKSRRYKCPKCPSAFEKRDQYSCHIQLHGSKQRYSCGECDYSVRYYCNILQHNKKHALHNAHPTELKEGDDFEGGSEPEDGENGAEPIMEHRCQFCDFTAPFRHLVDEHVETHVNDEGVERAQVDIDSDAPLVIDTENHDVYHDSDSE